MTAPAPVLLRRPPEPPTRTRPSVPRRLDPPPAVVPAPVRRPRPWGDAGWQVATVLLGPVAARNPDVAMALLAGADEVVAAGRARWRRCASVLAAGRTRT